MSKNYNIELGQYEKSEFLFYRNVKLNLEWQTSYSYSLYVSLESSFSSLAYLIHGTTNRHMEVFSEKFHYVVKNWTRFMCYPAQNTT